MDPDVFFLQSPQILLDSDLFKQNGALFFHDRSLFKSSNQFIEKISLLMPDTLSQYTRNLRSKYY